MLKKSSSRKGQSLIEYVSLIIFIIAAFLLFQKYIARGISGRWKQAGDSLGMEKVYQKGSDQCGNDVFTDRPDAWYEEECFRQRCFSVCIRARDTIAWNEALCRTCVDQTCPCPF